MQNDILSRDGLTRRGLGGLAAGLAASTMLAPAGVLAQGASSANLAMVDEPQSLDPMASTADLVGTIMQHVYEPLFTFDANWAIQPMLAAAQRAASPANSGLPT